jgi:hypothetical protein
VQVSEAVISHAKKDTGFAEEIAGSWIPKDYLEFESATDSGGDVARAFMDAERSAEREEAANYQPEQIEEVQADGTN